MLSLFDILHGVPLLLDLMPPNSLAALVAVSQAHPVCGAKLFCLLAETETETETRRNSDETLYLYHIFPECQRNVSKRQTHPFQYQDHEILEFRGTFTAFLSDLDRRSIIMYMLGLSTLANISQLSPCILLWSTTCTPWTAAGDSRCSWKQTY